MCVSVLIVCSKIVSTVHFCKYHLHLALFSLVLTFELYVNSEKGCTMLLTLIDIL